MDALLAAATWTAVHPREFASHQTLSRVDDDGDDDDDDSDLLLDDCRRPSDSSSSMLLSWPVHDVDVDVVVDVSTDKSGRVWKFPSRIALDRVAAWDTADDRKSTVQECLMMYEILDQPFRFVDTQRCKQPL